MQTVEGIVVVHLKRNVGVIAAIGVGRDASFSMNVLVQEPSSGPISLTT